MSSSPSAVYRMENCCNAIQENGENKGSQNGETNKQMFYNFFSNFRRNFLGKNDWLAEDPGWIATKTGRIGWPMRTAEMSFRIRLKSSIEDSKRNINDGNALMFECHKVH